MAFEFMSNYLFLAVGVVGGACSDVSQTFLQVPMYEKREKLLDLVRESANQSQGLPIKTLVFVETKKTADFLASYMCQSKVSATSIHGTIITSFELWTCNDSFATGDRQQREREEALKTFKMGETPVLVATAVAARGLDIKGVEHVVNYDLPTDIDEYVHR